MDNASKALIIAGGILVTMLVIGVALYMLSSARGFADASNTQAELSAVESFNRYYNSFPEGDKTILGIDVLNIHNKAWDDSHRDNTTHMVDVSVSYELINALDAATGSELLSTPFSYYIDGYDSDGYINHITISN